MSVLEEIRAERTRQDAEWGGPAHDDRHSSHDWLAYVVKHLGRAVMWPWDPVRYRRQMVIIGALAVAGIEWCDRLFPEDKDR